MKLLIFGIAVVMLGANCQANAADFKSGKAKARFEYSGAPDGKALLQVWEHDWRQTNLPLGCFLTRRVTTCALTRLQSNYICR
jgi:hypothetical protein